LSLTPPVDMGDTSGGKIQPGRETLDFTNQAAEDVHV
jgi:hypothetical protein